MNTMKFRARLLAHLMVYALGVTLHASTLAANEASAQAQEIAFSQFFKTPIGSAGLEFGERLRALAGQQVSISGYMVSRESPTVGTFYLAPIPIRMSEHADGDANDLPVSTLTVVLDPSDAQRIVAFRPGIVTLTGQLEVGRLEDAPGVVSWVRLKLPRTALAATSSEKNDLVPHRH